MTQATVWSAPRMIALVDGSAAANAPTGPFTDGASIGDTAATGS